MGLTDIFFKSTISKQVNKAIAQQFAKDYAKALDSLVAFMNVGLPTINPDGADYYKTFKTIGAVYETTDLISKKVINSPFVFYKVKDAKKLKQSKILQKSDPVQAYLMKLQATEEVDNLSLTKLFENPNPYQTGTQFLWTVVLSYLLYGNTYIHGTKIGEGKKAKVKELWCFPNMEIVADESNLLDPILGYILMNVDRTPFSKEDIYHVKTANPAQIDRTFEYLYGVAPLRAYCEPLRTIKEAKTQSSKQAKNGGVFGILSPRDKEDQLGPDQKKQLHDKMAAARRSDDEMARVFASSISLQWQAMGLPIADLQLLELVSANEEDVYRAFHVPLQYHNQKASTSNNQASAVRQLIYDAVAPNADALSEAFTRFVGPGYEDTIIELDWTQLPEMAVNMLEVAKYIAVLPKGVLTYDEMRLALRYGETGLDYMKAHYVENGLVKLQDVFNGTAPTTTNTPPPSQA